VLLKTVENDVSRNPADDSYIRLLSKHRRRTHIIRALTYPARLLESSIHGISNETIDCICVAHVPDNDGRECGWQEVRTCRGRGKVQSVTTHVAVICGRRRGRIGTGVAEAGIRCCGDDAAGGRS
jgi:hypothetical protein